MSECCCSWLSACLGFLAKTSPFSRPSPQAQTRKQRSPTSVGRQSSFHAITQSVASTQNLPRESPTPRLASRTTFSQLQRLTPTYPILRAASANPHSLRTPPFLVLTGHIRRLWISAKVLRAWKTLVTTLSASMIGTCPTAHWRLGERAVVAACTTSLKYGCCSKVKLRQKD